MTARDEILTRLRSKTRPTEPPAPWQSRRQFGDLVERFQKALTAVHGEVHLVNTLPEAMAQLGHLFEELNVERAVGNDEPLLQEANLPIRWPQITWAFAAQQPTEQLRAFCAAADVGISSAEAALAETGTVVVGSGAGKSRLVTLLPPIHIALVPASKLTTDLFTWAAARPQTAPPANTVFISGPSKTADIEQTMAIGVHGPKRFIVILIREM